MIQLNAECQHCLSYWNSCNRLLRLYIRRVELINGFMSIRQIEKSKELHDIPPRCWSNILQGANKAKKSPFFFCFFFLSSLFVIVIKSTVCWSQSLGVKSMNRLPCYIYVFAVITQEHLERFPNVQPSFSSLFLFMKHSIWNGRIRLDDSIETREKDIFYFWREELLFNKPNFITVPGKR